MIQRPGLLAQVEEGLRNSPITSILGPRQCGKTTLARQIAGGKGGTFFDLENPRDRARLERAQQVLERLRGLVVLDEVQRAPELFSLLRVLADRKPLPCRFLLLGSASPWLIRRTSESLAGRVRFVDMGGFHPQEVGEKVHRRLWSRGGFPISFLAKNDGASLAWRESFILTFLQRDLPELEIRTPSEVFRRFWTMVAHRHGQVWNGSEIGGSLGVTYNTARRYLDVLTEVFMVRQLQPYLVNTGKRIVKSPKVYVRDSGLLHALLGIGNMDQLEGHPKLGASWEGFALEAVLRRTGDRHAFFWATHNGAEVDLVLEAAGKRWGFEFKSSDAPSVTPSMRIGRKDLGLERLWVVHPGKEAYPLDDRIDVLPLARIGDLPKALRRS